MRSNSKGAGALGMGLDYRLPHICVGISNIGFLGANITTNVLLHDGTMYNGERDTWYTGFRLMFHASFY